MDVLIIRDGGATKVLRKVADMAEVEGLRASGFEVEVLGAIPPAATAALEQLAPAKPAKKPAKPKA